MSTVDNFQNTALQLFSFTALMNINRSCGYLTRLKFIYEQIPRNLQILLAFFKVSRGVSP